MKNKRDNVFAIIIAGIQNILNKSKPKKNLEDILQLINELDHVALLEYPEIVENLNQITLSKEDKVRLEAIKNSVPSRIDQDEKFKFLYSVSRNENFDAIKKFLLYLRSFNNEIKVNKFLFNLFFHSFK